MKSPFGTGLHRPRLPSVLTRVWQTDIALVEPASEAENLRVRRSAAIATKIAREVARRERVRLVRWGCTGLLAAAAAVALGVGIESLFTRPPTTAANTASASGAVSANATESANAMTEGNRITAGPDTFVAQSAAPRALHPGETSVLEVGETVRTDSGTAALDLGATARIALGSATELRIVEDGVPKRQIRLERGHLLVSVEKSRGRELVVSTPDARVIVHGTIFTVDVAASAADLGRTRVDVREGVVVVESAGATHELRAGGSWSTPTTALPNPLPESATAAPRTGSPTTSRGPHDAKGSGHAAQNPQSPAVGQVGRERLSTQNRAFEQGLLARDRGDTRAALAIFRELLRNDPASPIAESARLEIEAIERSGKH